MTELLITIDTFGSSRERCVIDRERCVIDLCILAQPRRPSAP